MDLNINTQLDFTDYLIHKLILVKEQMKDKPDDYTKQLTNIANSIHNLYNIHELEKTNGDRINDIRDYILNKL